MEQTFSIDKLAVERAFQLAAETYDNRSALNRLIADRLLDRLDFIRLKPTYVLDFGTRTGYAMEYLSARYSKAIILGMDLSLSLLEKAQVGIEKQHRMMVTGEYTLFPIEDQSIDLIFSNLALHWSENFWQTLTECQRILKPGGLFLFSTLGPDTLKELRASFADAKQHVHSFYDMHDIGDMLTHLHFVNPVMDREEIVVHYSSVLELVKDLKLTGAQNASKTRYKGLMGKNQWAQMLKSYEVQRKENGALPATVEVIYGHALTATKSSAPFENKEGDVLVPITAIKRNKGKN